MAEKKNDSTTLVNFRVDPAVKESAEAVLGGMGLSVSAYVGMCLRQVAQQRSIPFSPTVDADFWMAESVVSDAMALVNGGLFELALGKRKEIDSSISHALYERFRNKEGDICFTVWNFAGDPLYGGGETFLERYDYLDRGASASNELLEGLDHRNGQVAAFEEVKGMLVAMCREFLEGNGFDIDGMDDRGIVSAFDGCVWDVVDAYDQHRSNFALRFSGNGTGAGAYKLAAGLSSERKARNARADNRWNAISGFAGESGAGLDSMVKEVE